MVNIEAVEESAMMLTNGLPVNFRSRFPEFWMVKMAEYWSPGLTRPRSYSLPGWIFFPSTSTAIPDDSMMCISGFIRQAVGDITITNTIARDSAAIPITVS
jgi:hypothetical protein